MPAFKPGRLLWGALLLIGIGYATVRFARTPEATPFLRGKHLANANGCFACHGPGGLSGIPNPRAESDIPSWDGGNAEMYLKSDADIRAYIEDGQLRKEHGDEERDSALIRMPAYAALLDSRQIDDLMAYVKGVSAFYPGIPDSVQKGMRLAREKGCFGCHGPSGRGGIRNPGSFKGIIPGWDGREIRDVARNDSEIEEWIRSGTCKRLEANPIAHFFLHRQKIKMPAYDSVFNQENIRGIATYIRWLKQGR